MSKPLLWAVAYVEKQLADWRHAARSYRHWALPLPFNAGYVRRDTSGIDRHITEIEILRWRRTLARLTLEARSRRRQNDFVWFYWLAEFGTAVTVTLYEDAEERYGQVLTKSHKAKMNLNKAGNKATAARRKIGNATRSAVRAGRRGVSERHVRRILSGK